MFDNYYAESSHGPLAMVFFLGLILTFMFYGEVHDCVKGHGSFFGMTDELRRKRILVTTIPMGISTTVCFIITFLPAIINLF